ncbi:hypothetical protein SDC9_94901 [bioreactor metagenome]|uniref:Uncharacterized protein n=1 Tax=bioreactor metagenome TaxID=1076179 RepID=A0A645A522_9ZZZZ
MDGSGKTAIDRCKIVVLVITINRIDNGSSLVLASGLRSIVWYGGERHRIPVYDIQERTFLNDRCSRCSIKIPGCDGGSGNPELLPGYFTI